MTKELQESVDRLEAAMLPVKLGTGASMVLDADLRRVLGALRALQANIDGDSDTFRAQLIACREELAEQCRLNGKGSEREAALLGQIAQLQRDLAAARKDSERLDWFESKFKPHKEINPNMESGTIWHLKFVGIEVSTLREAIDAARAQQPPSR